MVAAAQTADGLIEVRVQEVRQLFNSLDPSPFLDKDLDDDAEEFIVGSAREIPAGVPLRIAVHLPEAEAATERAMALPAAMANYFAYRAGVADGELKELHRSGRRALSVGIPLLAACLIASHTLRSTLGEGPGARVIEESLVILGWVANWKPLEIFLYDGWPIRRRRDLLRRLAAATVDVVSQ